MEISDYGPLLTAEAFFEIDFGERIKAELEEGEIRPLVRGPIGRVTIAGNLLSCVGTELRGSGFRAYGSMLALRSALRSVRYPDVAVYATNPESAAADDRMWLDDPHVVMHVLPTSRFVKNRLADEYRKLPSIATIVFVDFETKAMRVIQRLGPAAWRDDLFAHPHDIELPSLSLTIPHTEIFARD